MELLREIRAYVIGAILSIGLLSAPLSGAPGGTP
jgi:hypothetical protein